MKLLIDAQLNSFSWAICNGGSVIERGRAPSLEEIREVQKVRGISDVFIDIAYRRVDCQAACTLYGWQAALELQTRKEIERFVHV